MSTLVSKCNRPWETIQINGTGEVWPCDWGLTACGNVRNSTLGEIWSGSGFEHYRLALLESSSPETCPSDCPMLKGISVPTESIATTRGSATTPVLRRVLVIMNDPAGSLLTGCMAMHLDSLLERLCGERSNLGFQLVLGCYITATNFEHALHVLDLCGKYRALPEYFLVQTDSDDPCSHVSRSEVNAYECVIDRLDKELWSRGLPKAPLSPALRQLSNLAKNFGPTTIYKSQLVYCSGSSESVSALRRGVDRCATSRAALRIGLSAACSNPEVIVPLFSHARSVDVTVKTFGGAGDLVNPLHNETELMLSGPLNGFRVRQLVSNARVALESRAVGSRHLTLHATDELRTFWNDICSRLHSAQLDSCSLVIPFWIDGRAVSVLEWIDVVEAVKNMCNSHGWHFDGGRPDLLSLGLDVANQYPEVTDVCSRQEQTAPSLSVLAPIYNRNSEVEIFLKSLVSSSVPDTSEVVLVDDGSTDQSWDTIVRYCRAMPKTLDFSIVRLRRENPYLPNTFTFRTGAARQAGLQYARGERILFLDPDQVIDHDCVSEHMDWGALGYDVVLGVRCYPGADWVYRTRIRMRHVAPLASYKHWWGWFFTGNASISRRALNAAGGFDETLQFWGLDDMDLGYRLEKTGARFWHTPRARVSHLPHVVSGGGRSKDERAKSCRFQMEVLFRKYLDPEILSTYRRFWSASHFCTPEKLPGRASDRPLKD